MNTIDRYISTTFISSYAIVLLVFVGVYIFGDVVANLDEFTSDRSLNLQQVLINIADYYGHNLPLYYQQLGGIAVALAASFTFAMMLRNNELTAIAATGVPLQRLAAPVLGCSVVLVAAWMANSELVVPHFAQKIARQRSDLGATGTAEIKCVRDDNNAILVAKELTAPHGILKNVYIVEPARPDGTRRLIGADAARYDPQRQTWLLDRGVLQVVAAAPGTDSRLDGNIRWVPLDTYAFTLSPDEVRLRQSSQWADLTNVAQMNQLLKTQHLPNLPAIAKARDIRFTQPLLAWILTLLAVPFFLTREPGDVLVAGGKALVLCGLCFAFTFLMHSMSAGAYTHVAVWAPVLLFGPVAVVHLANVKT
jgi:lipopolysaccharide export LptBFGC system permease protein LptF